MSVIDILQGREILDSRGRPTVQAILQLRSGVTASASVPSGASTGSAEALELRDGDPRRYGGLGCRQAAANIGDRLAIAVAGKDFSTQAELDQTLCAADGTPTKSRVGANAILAVSIAHARAVAMELGVPLFQHLADMIEDTPHALPRLTINLFSGGKHAGGQIPIQDVLLVPAAAQSTDDALATVYAVYQAAAELTARQYGTRALTADEGGLAPPFPDAETMLKDSVAAIRAAGFEPGRDVALAVDVASTHFYREGQYHLEKPALTASGMIDRMAAWCERYPIVSIEDGLAEDDWDHWPALHERLGKRALIIGDDLLCTNPERIRRAIASQSANALLLKVNQIGTLTEAAEACRLAREAGWKVTISARSGETEDDWLADLAVGWNGDQIKIGSITHSERLAKYNRLLAIESETGLPLNPWPGV